MRTVSLDQLTVLGVRPAELVDIAARAGYGAISPFIGAGKPMLPAVPLRAGDPDTIAMQRRMADTGVFINNADGFALFDDTSMEELRVAAHLMAQMGARGLVTLQFDSDAARGFDRFCQLNELAKEVGLPLVLEFTPLSRIASLNDALAYRARAGGDNIGILVDVFHLHRSGGTPADLLAMDRSLIKGAQLCDGPRKQTDEEYAEQALYERMIPGEGELPVKEFLKALPQETIFGVEVPLRSRERAGESRLERATRLMAATRALLAAVEV